MPLSSFSSYLPTMAGMLLGNAFFYFLAFGIKKARQQLQLAKEREKAEGQDF